MKRKNKAAEAIDYSEYKLSISEVLAGFGFGFAVSLAGLYLMYSNFVLSCAAAALFAAALVPLYRKRLIKKRKKSLLFEFRDMLETMHGSFSSGKNMSGAVEDALCDLCRLHGEKSLLASELNSLQDFVRNGGKTEDWFDGFALRSGLDDVKSFSDTLKASLSVGGNLQKTVGDCRDVICDRISTEAEIETVLASNKNELYIMIIMPFISSAAMKLMGSDISSQNPALDFAVRTAALAVFIISFLIGLKITDIRI